MCCAWLEKPYVLKKVFLGFKGFYRMSNAVLGICHVCQSQVGDLLKQLNTGTRKQCHMIAQELIF